MPDTRRDEPWIRQAVRGIGFVTGIGVGVMAVGAAIAAILLWAMGLG